MLRHLNQPLQVSTLAAQVNISQSQFFTLFKRHVGGTPMDYFIRLRLRLACHLLEDTEMSVKAIAYTLGYNDPFYFSRIFKSFNRIAPSKYRLLKIGARKLMQLDPACAISCANTASCTRLRWFGYGDTGIDHTRDLEQHFLVSPSR